MNNQIQTDWVKPTHQIGGLDHLGVQAPCINIYSQLLPGITNVTDRARYYSFYPWVFWSFQKKGWNDKEQLVKMFRRADCLFTLIAARHDLITEGKTSYSGGTVGKNTLEPKLKELSSEQSLKLSDYAHRNPDDASRYFMSKFGGLSQYYFGVLRDLKLFKGDSIESASVIKETGGEIAKAFDEEVPSELFLSIVENDHVTLEDLDKLLPFSPVNLASSTKEKELLTKLLLKGVSPFLNDTSELDITTDSASAVARSKTMAYQLLLAKKTSNNEHEFNVTLFRKLTYSQSGFELDNLDLPLSLKETTQQWQVYSCSEMLSIALQGVFFAMLQAIKPELALTSTHELAEYFWKQGIGATVLNNANAQNTQHYFINTFKTLPLMHDWQNDNHELQSVDQILSITSYRTGDIPEEELVSLINHCLIILIAICAREENLQASENIPSTPEYSSKYPVNLRTVQAKLNNEFANHNIVEAMISFSQQYCLENHWRVAMRKLRYQSQNTFRFEASERGLIVNAVPSATHTSPRFYQSTQVMKDLGLLSTTGRLTTVTKAGEQFIEAVV
jgi:hypothetical protein